MSSHRTSATSAAVPAAGTEGPAAEEPEEPKEPAEAMPIMAAIERDRKTKLKNATKTSARHSSTVRTLTPSAGYSGSSTRRTFPSTRRQLTQPQSVNLPSSFLLQRSGSSSGSCHSWCRCWWRGPSIILPSHFTEHDTYDQELGRPMRVKG